VRDEVRDIPLFPLDVVLFPGMALPLHVFEERYRLMVQECLEDNRQFGVVLAKEAAISDDLTASSCRRDKATQGETRRDTAAHTVGTSALITQVDTLDDGNLDIQTAGLERFRVLHLVRAEPYAIGRVEPFPLEQVRSREVVRAVRPTGDLFLKYLRLVGEVLGTVIQIEQTPRDPSSLAYLIGIALQVPMEEKQQLLSILSLPALLARESHILSREEILLQRMREFQLSNTGYVQGATGYVSLS